MKRSRKAPPSPGRGPDGSLGIAVSSLMSLAVAATWLATRALDAEPHSGESAAESLTGVVMDPHTWVVLLTILTSFGLSTFVLTRTLGGAGRRVQPDVADRLRRIIVSETETDVPASPDVETVLEWIDALHERNESLLVNNRLLQYEETRLKVVVDHLPDGVLATNADGKILYVNRAAAGMLGLNRKAVAGRPLAEACPDVETLSPQAHRSGRAILTRRDPDGERAFSLRRASMVDASGEVTGTVFALRDITQQESANRAQSEFISQISHELKAPLNTIVTYVDALADPELLTEDERREYYNNLNSEAQRMARLISNLLEISRIELGGLSARFNFLKPTILLKDLAANAIAQMEAQGQTFHATVPENLPALFGDKDLLSVAFSNLVANAIKYTPPGGTISLNVREETDALVVEVRDTGVGIPPDMTERIFERFVRSEQHDIQSRPGSGLGLALVKEIVELHEGHVEVESELGAGSTFRVRLPIRAVNDQINLSAA